MFNALWILGVLDDNSCNSGLQGLPHVVQGLDATWYYMARNRASTMFSEVIDLVSSPDAPSPPSKAISKPKPAVKSNGLSFSSLIDETHAPISQKADTNWFYLSDDNGQDAIKDVRSSRKTTNLMVTSPPGIGASEKRKSIREAPGFYGNVTDPFGFEDDFGRVKSSSLFKSGHLPSSMLRAEGLVSQKANGFHFVSDDLDSTLDADDIFGMASKERPAKKRRISPKANKKFTSIAPQKNKGLSENVSDIWNGDRAKDKVQKANNFKRSKTKVLESDPINLSSEDEYSRMARERRKRAKKQRDLEWGNGDDGSDDMTRPAPEIRKRVRPDDVSSELDLPALHNISSPVSTSKSPALSRKDSEKVLAEYNASKAAEKKKRERTVAAQEKLIAKEAEKERKRLVREEKARDKQIAADLAKANTLRTDKKVSAREMTICFPLNLDSKLADQARSFLGPFEVKFQWWASSVPNVIKWRRKVEAMYDEEEGQWELTDEHEREEKHVMCIMLAQEFVDLAMGDTGDDLDTHVLKMKAKFKDCAIIYLIEGLTTWMRKNKNIRNRQFTEAVRRQMGQGFDDPPPRTQRRKTKQQEYVDADMIEDALLRLQVMHGVFVHHTAAMIETATWIMAFTQHISTIPYRYVFSNKFLILSYGSLQLTIATRLQKMSLDTGFCMDAGQVKSGDNAADTFVKMLQEINRLTAPIAYGIAAEYPSVKSLVEGFEENGKDILMGLKKSANKDGALTDRDVGKKISRRVWGIFMGWDERSTDV